MKCILLNKLKITSKKIIFKYLNFLLNILKKYLCLLIEFKDLSSSIKGHNNFILGSCFYSVIIDNMVYFYIEYNNINMIKKKYPEIACIIPKYKYLFLRKIIIQKTFLLKDINNTAELYSHAYDLLYLFRKYGKRNKISILEMENIIKGIDVIKYHYGVEMSDLLYNDLKFYMDNNEFYIGFCHGDFHGKNIMKSNNNVYIIDMDCVREKSIQEFDLIYFLNQEISVSNDISWVNGLLYLNKYLNNDDNMKKLIYLLPNKNTINFLLFLYFFDRLGQDFSFNRDYLLFSKNEISEILMSFTENMFLKNKIQLSETDNTLA